MKRKVVFAWLALLAPLTALAQTAPEAMPVQLNSKHYHISATATKEEAQELLEFMELVHHTYLQLLKPDDPAAVESKTFTLVLYKNNDEYVASGAPKGSGAFYNGKLLVGFYDDFMMRPYFAHEGMHQFTDITSKAFRNFPMWFSEGIADCIGNSIVKGNKLYMCAKSGGLARGRLPVIQRQLRDGKAYPMREFLALSRDKFMADQSNCYPQAWSFCHFLICYPRTDDPNVQIPDGSFRKNLAIYYELMRTGNYTHQKAWGEAFKGFTLDQIEGLWKKYIANFDGPKSLGFEAKELTDEECGKLGLPADQGGIRMEKIKDGMAGKEAGAQDNDVIVEVNGKPMPRKKPLALYRDILGDWPFNRKLKVVVIRNGERVEMTASWPKPK